MRNIYSPYTSKTVKFLHKELEELTSKYYSYQCVQWIHKIHYINTLRVLLTTRRGENWIKYIWSKVIINGNNIWETNTKKNVVYLMFNLQLNV